MKQNVTGKNKHLTYEQRCTILEEIKKGTTLKDIAEKVGKDPTTVSKEVKLHRYLKENKSNKKGGGLHCINYYKCSVRNLCGGTTCSGFCKSCSIVNCSKKCNAYVEDICKQTTRFPYVCFGCHRQASCRFAHYAYDPKLADREYHESLISSREGINLTYSEFKKLDDIIYDGVSRGLSIYAILQLHPEISVSERTVYRYIEQKYTKTISLDLRRKVTYKERYKSKVRSDIVNKYREGRLYSDYIKFIADNQHIEIPQLDLVIGKQGDNQVLLTIIFPVSNLMIGYLIPNKEPSSVASVFNYLHSLLGSCQFKELFPAILTDRGSEFYEPVNIEFDNDTGELRTKLFYCDSYSSCQKAQIERNHEFIRYFIPKGKSLNDFTQDDINLMFSHINSYPRESKKNHTPYEIFSFMHGREILDKIKITNIQPGDLNLTTKIFKK